MSDIYLCMVRSNGYKTSAQKAGRSAGQRKKRMASKRKRRNREAGVYPISVDPSTIKGTNFEDNPVFGIYSEDNKWYLTAMIVKRTREKLVSDRQGAVKSETVDKLVVSSFNSNPNPRDGIIVNSDDTKKELMNSEHIESTSRIDTGTYVVYIDQWDRFSTYKVDRDKYQEFKRKRSTNSIR